MQLDTTNPSVHQSAQTSKSRALGLVFPYDWSNPDIPDDALILNVLKRGIFEDICRICVHYGLPRVEALIQDLPPDPIAQKTRDRMLRNIRKGLSDAKA